MSKKSLVLHFVAHKGYFKHLETENINFRVTDSKRKTDEEVLLILKKNHKIENPHEISKLPKSERNKILATLKDDYPVRQLQRLTGISRGVITKA